MHLVLGGRNVRFGAEKQPLNQSPHRSRGGQRGPCVIYSWNTSCYPLDALLHLETTFDQGPGVSIHAVTYYSGNRQGTAHSSRKLIPPPNNARILLFGSVFPFIITARPHACPQVQVCIRVMNQT